MRNKADLHCTPSFLPSFLYVFVSHSSFMVTLCFVKGGTVVIPKGHPMSVHLHSFALYCTFATKTIVTRDDELLI